MVLCLARSACSTAHWSQLAVINSCLAAILSFSNLCSAFHWPWFWSSIYSINRFRVTTTRQSSSVIWERRLPMLLSISLSVILWPPRTFSRSLSLSFSISVSDNTIGVVHSAVDAATCTMSSPSWMTVTRNWVLVNCFRGMFCNKTHYIVVMRRKGYIMRSHPWNISNWSRAIIV